MKILLVTRGKYLKHPEDYFNNQYRSIKTIPILAGGFGWFWSKALAELGHQVIPFIFYNNPVLDYFSEVHQFIERCRCRFPIATKLPVELMNTKLIRVVKKYKPALILIDAGNLIYPETLQEIKRISSAKLVNWLLDDPIRQHWDNVIKSLRLYDLVFICDRGLLNKFSQMGASFIDYLPAACDPDIHRTLMLDQQEIRQLDSKLCFIGTVTAHRVDYLRALVFPD